MTEDELVAHWDAAHLAVYADQLVEAGDPRGELVALDLADSTDEIRARKLELLVAWVGEQLLGRIQSCGSIEHGFVEVSVEQAQLLRDVLASPAGPYVRSLRLHARTPALMEMLDVLLEAPRPWLVRLAVIQEEQLRGRRLHERWGVHLPRLRSLEVEGDRVFERLSAPQVQDLKLTCGGAIASLSDGAAPWLNLRSLDIAFGPGGGHPRTELAAEAVPALVSLDLSRNEPGRFGPHNYGLDLDVFDWLARNPMRGQLVDLKVPSVRSEAQSALLVNAIADMPRLQRIEQVRRYAPHDARFPVPPHVQRVLGWPRPWPPPDELNAHAYIVEIPGEPIRVDAFPLARWLDEHAARLHPHVVDAWGHVFATLIQLVGDQTRELPAPMLDTALSVVEDTPSGLEPWRRVRNRVRYLRPMRVAIRRV